MPQVLNRDLWSNPGVKTIIREHFVFWQQYKEADEAERYMTFYKVKQKYLGFNRRKSYNFFSMFYIWPLNTYFAKIVA